MGQLARRVADGAPTAVFIWMQLIRLAAAIVLHHDVDEARYLASAADFPPLATLCRMGAHGTLIQSQWVLTAPHAAFCLELGQPIRVG